MNRPQHLLLEVRVENGQVNKHGEFLEEFLDNGYVIVSSVPVSTNNYCAVQYVLARYNDVYYSTQDQKTEQEEKTDSQG